MAPTKKMRYCHENNLTSTAWCWTISTLKLLNFHCLLSDEYLHKVRRQSLIKPEPGGTKQTVWAWNYCQRGAFQFELHIFAPAQSWAEKSAFPQSDDGAAFSPRENFVLICFLAQFTYKHVQKKCIFHSLYVLYQHVKTLFVMHNIFSAFFSLCELFYAGKWGGKSTSMCLS